MPSWGSSRTPVQLRSPPPSLPAVLRRGDGDRKRDSNLDPMKQFAKAAIFLIAAVCIGVACRPASAETIAIHHFNGSDGISPVGPMVADGAGNLYGVTFYGGLSHWGVVYELSPPAIRGGKWTETVLHSFSGGFDGAAPSGGLTL